MNCPDRTSLNKLLSKLYRTGCTSMIQNIKWHIFIQISKPCPIFCSNSAKRRHTRPWTRWCINCVQDVCKSISWHIGCIILVLSHTLMLCVDGGRASQTNINIELSLISLNKLEESVCSAHPYLLPAISVISNQRLSLHIRLHSN